MEGTRISADRCRQERGKIDRLQEEGDGAEYPFHAHVHGAWLLAPHLRDLRSLLDLRGHGLDFGSQRFSDTRSTPTPRNRFCSELREFAELSVHDESAIICLVGENIRLHSGRCARAFQLAWRASMSRMISQGASALNLGFVVAGGSTHAVRALHREFFTELDPAVFDDA